MSATREETTVDAKRWSRRPEIILLAAAAALLPVVMLAGWFWSLHGANRQLRELTIQLQYAEEELDRARTALNDRDRLESDRTRSFWLANLDGARLAGATISIPDNSFQRADFGNCNLADATLQGGDSSFQMARFDGARLTNAKLSGGSAAFQGATFDGADLTDAVLTGGTSSLQGASFENARLVRARLAGSFQGTNISGARFEGADLSALDAADLASCFFQEAPTYDDQTSFPTGFDPEEHLWRRAGEQPQ
jgi:uncharacterized protein YjbI with pentapeptide repeats